jgi:hypothetical protein
MSNLDAESKARLGLEGVPSVIEEEKGKVRMSLESA